MREQRIDRRRSVNRSGKRRMAVVLRQRGGRTLTRTLPQEAQGVDVARESIEPGSVVCAHEIAHWDLLDPDVDMRRINHSEACSRGGAHTNLAESYFSRLRRMIGGQHLRVEGRFLDDFATAAWLEDHRSESNGPWRIVRSKGPWPRRSAWPGRVKPWT
ncbi:transposase [Rhodobacter sp. CZR27]|uniref:transposase n=1 Tax=Rhodobacter sp. CZR27 TaxID=2033869 RepID=UPI003742793A